MPRPLEHLERDVRDVAEIALAVDQRDVDVLAGVVADLLRRAETGEVAAEDQDSLSLRCHVRLL